MLKNAGLDGADVKVELKGYYDEGGDDERGHVLKVKACASSLLGFIGFELRSPDSSPLEAKITVPASVVLQEVMNGDDIS